MHRSLVPAVGLVLLVASSAHAQTADNVLVVINENSPASVEIAEYYANARSIGPDNVARINT